MRGERSGVGEILDRRPTHSQELDKIEDHPAQQRFVDLSAKRRD